jgi:hypothetical protein
MINGTVTTAMGTTHTPFQILVSSRSMNTMRLKVTEPSNALVKPFRVTVPRPFSSVSEKENVSNV